MASSPSPHPAKHRSLLIAGNWKMSKTLPEARVLAGAIAAGLPGLPEPRVALFPPAISLAAVVEVVKASSKSILVGAQNMHYEEEGAFTGEVSAQMILSAGAKAVLIGHSERRHIFGETDEAIAKKAARALESGLLPILCVGEKLEERERGETSSVVSRQLAAGISGARTAADLARITIAYEPVWAIGTGKTATPAQGEEVHTFLRQELRKAFLARHGSPDQAEETTLLYGGSVKPENAHALLSERDIDGLLVGGASLDADSFLKICRAAT